MAEIDARVIGVAIVIWNLAAVVTFDAITGEAQRVERFSRALRDGSSDFTWRDAEAKSCEISALSPSLRT
jgi:hypothetical protein